MNSSLAQTMSQYGEKAGKWVPAEDVTISASIMTKSGERDFWRVIDP